MSDHASLMWAVKVKPQEWTEGASGLSSAACRPPSQMLPATRGVGSKPAELISGAVPIRQVTYKIGDKKVAGSDVSPSAAPSDRF